VEQFRPGAFEIPSDQIAQHFRKLKLEEEKDPLDPEPMEDVPYIETTC